MGFSLHPRSLLLERGDTGPFSRDSQGPLELCRDLMAKLSLHLVIITATSKCSINF